MPCGDSLFQTMCLISEKKTNSNDRANRSKKGLDDDETNSLYIPTSSIANDKMVQKRSDDYRQRFKHDQRHSAPPKYQAAPLKPLPSRVRSTKSEVEQMQDKTQLIVLEFLRFLLPEKLRERLLWYRYPALELQFYRYPTLETQSGTFETHSQVVEHDTVQSNNPVMEVTKRFDEHFKSPTKRQPDVSGFEKLRPRTDKKGKEHQKTSSWSEKKSSDLR